MKTKLELIENYKSTYPVLKKGSDEEGYVELNDREYQATIEQWADDELAAAEIKENYLAAKAAVTAKLAALGLTTDDLKALGL